MIGGTVLHNSSRAINQPRRESGLLGSRDLSCEAAAIGDGGGP
ncbi:MAG: hypothetical protein PHO07_07850 [Pirellulales bacterium]|jgi:hypothetical protein|nr:hypothetical protein [Pirellulales bacterium]